MNNSKTLLTIGYKVDCANIFISAITQNDCYLFAANHIDSSTVAQPYNSVQDTLIDVYYNMIFGKKIRLSDMSLMIRRVDWQNGIVYTPYDHYSSTLFDDDFYVCIQDGTQYDVFKCLENGNGSPSTVAPSRLNVNSDNDDFFYPTDGYRWKYMYSISEQDFDKFSTSSFIPVSTDAGAKAHARNGTIDVIRVANTGAGYSNYLTGTFGIADIRLNGDSRKYAISSPNVNTSNDFYTGCYLLISSGPGSGQFRRIVSYTSNSTYNFVILDNEFDISDDPRNGSTYEIYPSVIVVGDGSETVEAKARAVIDPSSNSVARVEMLDKGENYSLASAYISVANSVGVISQASVVPIFSPAGGHGSNAPMELGCKYSCVSVEFNRNESGTIPATNDYSQIGIIKNPRFRDVTLSITDSSKDFYSSDTVYKINPKQLAGLVSTNRDGNGYLTSTLTVTDTVSSNIVAVGDEIFIWYNSNYMLATVQSTTSTTITLDKIALFDTKTDTANVYIANTSSYGSITGFAVGEVTLTDVQGEFNVGDEIIGVTTGVHAYVSNVSISGVTKNFSTFVQCYRYDASITQGSFQEDEQVYQISNTAARALLHSAVTSGSNTTIYVTNQVGTFNTSGSNNQITGLNSGAIASLTNKYLPDLVFASGEIVYLENGESISRTSETAETFKIILQF